MCIFAVFFFVFLLLLLLLLSWLASFNWSRQISCARRRFVDSPQRRYIYIAPWPFVRVAKTGETTITTFQQTSSPTNHTHVYMHLQANRHRRREHWCCMRLTAVMAVGMQIADAWYDSNDWWNAIISRAFHCSLRLWAYDCDAWHRRWWMHVWARWAGCGAGHSNRASASLRF